MGIENLDQEKTFESVEEMKEYMEQEGIELTDEQLEAIAGGVTTGKTKKLVCDACGYTIAATVDGIQTMVKHCSSKHKNAKYHVV